MLINLILPITLLCTSCDWFSDWSSNDQLEKLPPDTPDREIHLRLPDEREGICGD